MNRNKITTIVLIIAFLAGLCLLLYPKGSDYWKSFHQTRAITQYVSRFEEMDETDYLTFVDGTCVEWLRSRKHRSDNTSGHRGVYEAPNGRWRVSIGFKRKRYYIGSYETFEEAKEARLTVEKKLHDDFVLAWEKWNSFAVDDSDWAEDNPFIFDVYRIDGEIVVYAPILNRALEDA